MNGDQCKNLQELTRAVAAAAVFPDDTMRDKRKAFAEHVKAFHRDSQIPLQLDYEGIVLMSAHQPNFLPYSGVVRKTVLVHAVAEQLRERLECPVIELFCFADQDFANERWFREAQLPSVRNRNGTLALHLPVSPTFNNKLMCRVPKPRSDDVAKLRSEIERWTSESLDSVTKHATRLGLPIPDVDLDTGNISDVVERAYERSTNAADFNAFFLAYLIEQSGYKTAFARFSECQQVFGDEIAFLLENYDRYARLMAESQKNRTTKPPMPIWYHCPCGGKADVEMIPPNTLSAKCRACATLTEFPGDLRSALEQMLPNVSLRAEAMLIGFSGIGVSFYVGGYGGTEYLGRAEKIARGLRMRFPVVSVWRPKDVYGGIGQLDAILELLRVRSKYNLVKDMQCDLALVQDELDDILADIDGVICAFDNLKSAVANRKLDGFKEKIATIVTMQNELKTRFERNQIARDRSIIGNTSKTLTLIPSVIDYAINIGIRSTFAQWLSALEAGKDLNADVPLRTNPSTDALFDTTKQLCTGDVFG
jgi:hypothetical protein